MAERESVRLGPVISVGQHYSWLLGWFVFSPLDGWCGLCGVLRLLLICAAFNQTAVPVFSFSV